MRWWNVAVLIVIACACGEKKLPPPKTDFEAFERAYVVQYAALAKALRGDGREIADKDIPKDYRAVYVGASGVWVDRKLVATLAEIEGKRAELVAAIEANATLLPTIGFTQPTVTFDIDTQPASAAMAAVRLFADRPTSINVLRGARAETICLATIRDHAFKGPEETVELSLLVQKDRVWLGMSRVNEFYEILRRAEDHDYEKIETTLKEQKANVFFVDRAEMEIAVTEGTALELFAMMDIACKVGFFDLAIIPREQLSANPSI